MKNFRRENQLLSLCGLNCGLCSMHLGGHCPGCGGGEGNQSCAIAKCSFTHGNISYCWQCAKYPCKKYDGIEEFDSFITHKHQRKDLLKAKKIGIESYNAEQLEKIEILHSLLSNYNDGRKKTFFCVAVNLLELQELKAVMKQLANQKELISLTAKERAAHAVNLFQDIAAKHNLILKLHKKTKK